MSAAVVIMAGGTGGHVFPALAVAEGLRARGLTVSWLGTRRGLEAELVPAAGYEIDWLSIAGLRGNGLAGWLLAPLRLGVALLQAAGALRRRRPVAVLGMGGFASGPGGVAARLL
ncbi:MAG TPA: glycosyltransferase, partial [Gammaproteobacteria bacterium]